MTDRSKRVADLFEGAVLLPRHERQAFLRHACADDVTDGGSQPAWSRAGDELFFRGPDGELQSVRIERGDKWVAGTPRTVLDTPFFLGPANSGRTYDVSPDGRFLVIKDVPPEEGSVPTIVVTHNWFEDLTRLAPAG